MTTEKTWHLAINGNQEGPYSREEVVEAIRSGRADRQAHIFGAGMEQWAPLGSRPEFAAELGPATVPPPPPRGLSGAHEIDYEIFGEEMQFHPRSR